MAITRIPGLRGIVRGFMPRAIAMGLNTVQFEGLIRSEFGQLYKRKTFLADFREMAGRERKRGILASIRKGLYATPESIQYSGFEQKDKFYYGYKVRGWDAIQGKVVEQPLIVSSSVRLTEGQADDEAVRLQHKYFPEITATAFVRDYVSVGQPREYEEEEEEET